MCILFNIFHGYHVATRAKTNNSDRNLDVHYIELYVFALDLYLNSLNHFIWKRLRVTVCGRLPLSLYLEKTQSNSMWPTAIIISLYANKLSLLIRSSEILQKWLWLESSLSVKNVTRVASSHHLSQRDSSLVRVTKNHDSSQVESSHWLESRYHWSKPPYPNFQEFHPNFRQIKTFGGELAPLALHHWMDSAT